MALTSNVLKPEDIQSYLSRARNSPPDPMTLLKQGGVTRVAQPQAVRPVAPQAPATPAAASAVQGGQITGLGGAIHALPGINASGMTLGASAPRPASGGILSSLIPTAHAQTMPAQTAATQPIASQPAAPTAQASYGGGSVSVPVPTMGTPEYAAAQNLAKTAASPSSTTQAPIASAQTSQPAATPQIPGAFSSFLGGLGAMGFGGSPQVNKAAQDLATFRQQYANTLADVQGDPNLSMDTKTGIGQMLANRAAEQENALSGALQAAISGQGQQISALSSGATAAAPTTVPYSSQFISPETGQPIGGGAVTGNLNDAVNTYASRVLGGKMSYDQATQALSSYGPAGQTALTKALGPDFSTVQSNINAAIQGQLGPAAQNAASQLQNLQTTLASSPALERTFSPAFNSLYSVLSASTGLQAGGTQALQSAITDARAAMANALGVANNSTPSAYDSYVHTLIPDGVTPSQLSQSIQQFNNQIAGKLGAYQTPGGVQYGSGSQTSSGASSYSGHTIQTAVGPVPTDY